MIGGLGRSRASVWLGGLAAVCVLAAGTRAALKPSHGLVAEYFASTEWNAPRVLQVRAHEISTRQVTADWNHAPPGTFRARWFGYLTVPRAGDYTFSPAADDRFTLSIDGQAVAEPVRLGRGSHFVLIEHVRDGEAFEFAWSWARADTQPAVISWHVLSPNRMPSWRSRLLDALDWIALIALAPAVVIAGRVAWARLGARTTRLVGQYPRAAALLLFAALAVCHTWPLASDPAHLSRNDNGDTLLNEWALAWFAHQAPRAPLRLFEANIYYPERHTLAYSEAMIVQAAMGAPLGWIGASPVLTYNLVLLAGFALTGWATALVVARWTGDWAAGLTSGFLFGFNAHTLARIPHLQAQHVEFLPLSLAALDALLREPGVRQALRLAGWFTLQALTSVYLLAFSAFAMTAAAFARPDWYASRRIRKVAPHIALAAGLASLTLLPYLLPYWRLSRDPWFSRPLGDAVQYSASWTDYLATPGRLHFAVWSQRFWAGDGLFPGIVGTLLTGVALARGVAFRDPRARMCLAVGAVAVYLSFGTKAPGYATLYEFVPLLHAIRAPVRFGHIAIFSVAVLAGFGLIEIRRRVPARARTPLVVAVLALVSLEVAAAPLFWQPYSGIPSIYRQLRSDEDALVVELPLPHATFINARYMLYSTEHFRPMLNGYSGFVPRSYYDHLDVLEGFPDARSLNGLRAIGITHAFVHLDQLTPEAAAALERTPGLTRVAVEGAIALFAVAAAP